MIIVKLSGGLGNQLFQYSFGLSLAEKYKVTLKVDDSGYRLNNNRETPRNFLLPEVIEGVVVAEKKEINQVAASWQLSIGRWLSKINIYPFPGILFERKQFNFDPSCLSAGSSCYLHGYWQSYKYFESIYQELLGTKKNYCISKSFPDIDIQQSILVHIRRGDYVNHHLHNLLDMDYYVRAIEMLIGMISKPIQIVVVSDDINWCKRNLKWNSATRFIEGLSDTEQFLFMTNFRYYVIANSTFSWWSSYLSSQQNKIVVAPKNWINSPSFNSSDFFPQAWYVI